MLPVFSFLAFLHTLQSRIVFVRFIGAVVFAALGIIYVSNSNKAEVPLWSAEGKSAGVNGGREVQQGAAAGTPAGSRKAAALSTVKTPDYEAALYWAIPFTPRGNGEGLIQADSGSQFVLLDLSIQNTTTDRAVNVGEMMLSAKIQDENGREYSSDPLIIAAFNLEYPYPHHKDHYSALKGVLQPGEIYRTVVFGFEAPVDTKKFVLLLEGGGNSHENSFYQAAFCLK